MPAIREKSVMVKFLPMAFGVPQDIYVYHEGMKHRIWIGSKMDPSENAESKGKVSVVDSERS